jgi:hypothetical protein
MAARHAPAEIIDKAMVFIASIPESSSPTRTLDPEPIGETDRQRIESGLIFDQMTSLR